MEKYGLNNGKTAEFSWSVSAMGKQRMDIGF